MDQIEYIDLVTEWVPQLEAAGWDVGVVNDVALPGLIAVDRAEASMQVWLSDVDQLTALIAFDPANAGDGEL